MSPKHDEVPIEDELAAMPLFAGLTEEQLGDVAASMCDRTARTGKTVIKERHWDHEFIIVLSGELEVSRGGNVVATIGSGDCVGEAAVAPSGQKGAEVVTVKAGSPAADAGLQPGDVITAVGGKAVTSPASLASQIIAYSPGEAVKITCTRNGADVRVRLGNSGSTTTTTTTLPSI